MCNKLHNDALPVPRRGRAYKLVEWIGARMYPVTGGESYKGQTCHGWITWDESERFRDDGVIHGFCAIRSLSTARRARRRWIEITQSSFTSIIPIDYEEGMGEHDERHFLKYREKPIRTMIVKKWRPAMNG